MRKLTLMLIAAALAAAAQPAPKQGQRLQDFFAHDPCILADTASHTYYLYTAEPAREGRAGVLAYQSKDLTSWDGPTRVFSVPDGLWANPKHGLWAPEVHLYRGRYYLFATLHNNDTVIAEPPATWRKTTRRATQIFVADSPLGPFTAVAPEPQTPAGFMTLDGTLWVEDGVPYMVYAHEWIQLIDGTMEAIPLKSDLSAAAGEPFHLFKASDAPWLAEQYRASKAPRHYITDGPFLYRSRTGRLLMIWSSWKEGIYAETIAWSTSGRIRGPWRQLAPLLSDDTGHGMLFQAFDGRLMLVAHSPTMSPLSRARVMELEDRGDTLAIGGLIR